MPRGIYDHSMLAKSPERFWDKVDKTGDCWLWTGGKSTLGYGVFTLHKREQYYAHRWSYEQVIGEIPVRMTIDHKCHNPSCVNPEHLRLATQHQQLMNTSLRKDNTTGYKGVTPSGSGTFIAQIQYKGKCHYLGTHKTAQLAHEAYIAKSKELFGEFAYVDTQT